MRLNSVAMKSRMRDAGDFNVMVTIGDRTQCAAAWAEEAAVKTPGITPRLVHTRLRNGWTPERAVFEPPAKRKQGWRVR